MVAGIEPDLGRKRSHDAAAEDAARQAEIRRCARALRRTLTAIFMRSAI
jgi:hypothetical protein